MNIFVVLLFTFLLFVSAPSSIFSQQEKESINQEEKVSPKEAKEEVEKEIRQEKEGAAKEKIEQPPQSKSILEIKGIEEQEGFYSLELKDVELADFFRVVAHNYHLNILVDEEVKGKITASLTNVTLEEALERIVEANHLALEKKGNIIIIKPNLITKVFVLK
ncbi:MAG: secretin and TonB N-terminal domain-containing protein, partial [Candidatus Omnitrophica bacterium]|nr:secretin and TonB N-terminal domain-containing protein [Candidatus Omnitrophota bacterium]